VIGRPGFEDLDDEECIDADASGWFEYDESEYANAIWASFW